MRRSRSTFASVLGFGLTAACFVVSGDARAQACCSAASAVTPARLTTHERGLVGLELRSQGVIGSYGPYGAFSAMPDGSSEVDLSVALLAAVRIGPRVQLAALVPWQTTRRVTPDKGDLGAGFGDANLGVRVEVLREFEHRYVPGIAVLVGSTLPTGRPPELARGPLAADATGIGAVQLHAAVALEKRLGHWLVGATGLVAQRLTRLAGPVETTLGTQLTALVNASYIFPNLSAVAASVSYSGEGDASIDGEDRPDTGRRSLHLAISGLYPISSRVRFQSSLFVTPPISDLGRNQNAVVGGSFAALTSF
ncbi:MAG: hypothetical protein FJ095_00120 [Deltaproteobacteria bacterium]|nr:hypothetical protein [Deltaproteobacteria bacterium]